MGSILIVAEIQKGADPRGELRARRVRAEARRRERPRRQEPGDRQAASPAWPRSSPRRAAATVYAAEHELLANYNVETATRGDPRGGRGHRRRPDPDLEHAERLGRRAARSPRRSTRASSATASTSTSRTATWSFMRRVFNGKLDARVTGAGRVGRDGPARRDRAPSPARRPAPPQTLDGRIPPAAARAVRRDQGRATPKGVDLTKADIIVSGRPRRRRAREVPRGDPAARRTRSAARWAHRAPSSTRAGSRTSTRSAPRARS